MNAREYLMQFRELDYIAEEKREAYLLARERAESIPSSLAHSDSPRSHEHSKAEDRILKLSDARRAYVDAAYDALLKMDEIAWFIAFIPGIEGTLLYERYIQRKKWDQIADDCDMTLPGIYAAHARALKIVQDLLDNDTDSKSVYWDPVKEELREMA